MLFPTTFSWRKCLLIAWTWHSLCTELAVGLSPELHTAGSQSWVGFLRSQYRGLFWLISVSTVWKKGSGIDLPVCRWHQAGRNVGLLQKGPAGELGLIGQGQRYEINKTKCQVLHLGHSATLGAEWLESLGEKDLGVAVDRSWTRACVCPSVQRPMASWLISGIVGPVGLEKYIKTPCNHFIQGRTHFIKWIICRLLSYTERHRSGTAPSVCSACLYFVSLSSYS